MGKPKMFTGTLNQNKVLNTLYNMIISQEVFSKNINLKGTLVEKFRVDGTLYGDTKLFISTDVGTVYNFPDTTKNLLSKTQPHEPKTQAVTMDTFKQTAITIDAVKLKQAFMSADIYGAFISVVVQWLRDSMKVLNVTLMNTFVGTVYTEAVKAEIDVDLPKPVTTSIVEMRNYENFAAELIGAKLADIIIDLEDALRDYNDYGFLRAYDTGDFMIVWNKHWSNKIRHISLPNIFHKDEVLGEKLDTITINDRYFGKIKETAGTANGTTIRTTVDVVVEDKQYFPGDILPNATAYKANEAYEVDNTVIAKIVHKRAIPFMSGLVVQTEFYNPKDLDRNHYLTWGYNELTYLKEFPVLTLKAKVATT